jgi:hypothetical protein
MWEEIQKKKAREEDARKKKGELERRIATRSQTAWDDFIRVRNEKKKSEDARKARNEAMVKPYNWLERLAREEALEEEHAREEAKVKREKPSMTQLSKRHAREDDVPEEEGRVKHCKFPRSTQ